MRPISKQRKVRELDSKLSFYVGDSARKFQLENLQIVVTFAELFLKYTFLEARGLRNAENLKVKKVEFEFTDLPDTFDGYTILFISDLHIDGLPKLGTNLVRVSRENPHDICILGGDYRFKPNGNSNLCIEYMKVLVPELLKDSPVQAILGNHDEYLIGQALDKSGADVLINEHRVIERNGEKIYLCGVDDCHYFIAQDLKMALDGVPGPGFKILICHSPEIYREAETAGIHLCFSGHTHAGQICLPGGFMLIKNAKVPRKLITGKWKWKNLQGYTSTGAGASGVPARFNSTAEVVLTVLKKAK